MSGRPKLAPDEAGDVIEGVARSNAPDCVHVQPRARILWTASLVVATLGGVAAALMATTLGGAGHRRADASSTALPRAADLRHRADEACDARRWKECEDFLDKARELDAAGEQTPAVQQRRGALRAGLGPSPGATDGGS